MFQEPAEELGSSTVNRAGATERRKAAGVPKGDPCPLLDESRSQKEASGDVVLKCYPLVAENIHERETLARPCFAHTPEKPLQVLRW